MALCTKRLERDSNLLGDVRVDVPDVALGIVLSSVRVINTFIIDIKVDLASARPLLDRGCRLIVHQDKGGAYG